MAGRDCLRANTAARAPVLSPQRRWETGAEFTEERLLLAKLAAPLERIDAKDRLEGSF